MGKWMNSNNHHEVTDQTFATEIYQRCTFEGKIETYLPYLEATLKKVEQGPRGRVVHDLHVAGGPMHMICMGLTITNFCSIFLQSTLSRVTKSIQLSNWLH